MKIGTNIIGFGSFLPNNVITNNDLSNIVETNDEWIVSRTGIKQRYIAPEGVLSSDLGSEAAKNAMRDAGISPDDIDGIIVATTTPDLTFPSTGAIIQSKIGAKNAFAFDVQAVCSGFIYALVVADSMIKNSLASNILVIGCEVMSKIINWQDRTTCVLFGDGAGAVVLSKSNDNDKGLIASHMQTDGNYSDILKTTGSFITSDSPNYLTMKGVEVYKHAVEKMHSSVMECLNKASKTVDDIDLFIPHQANIRIIDAVGEKLAINGNKVVKTVDIHANTSAATIPLAMDHAKKQGLLKPNQNIVLTAIGGGLAWGSVFFRT